MLQDPWLSPGHRFFKGRKLAVVVHNDPAGPSSASDMVSSQTSSVAPSFTAEQYSQLLQLLSKYSSNTANVNSTGGFSAAGFLVGKRYCMFTSFSSSTWVINSGASDHITPDFSLLHNVRKV